MSRVRIIAVNPLLLSPSIQHFFKRILGYRSSLKDHQCKYIDAVDTLFNNFNEVICFSRVFILLQFFRNNFIHTLLVCLLPSI